MLPDLSGCAGVKLFFQQSTTSCLAVAPGSCESIVGSAQLNVPHCDSNTTAIVAAEPPSIYAAGGPVTGPCAGSLPRY